MHLCTSREVRVENNTARWETKFARTVRRYGVAKLAHELQIEPGAVYQWIRGSVSPRPDKAMALVILLLPIGRLSLQDVYRHRLAIPGGELAAKLDVRPLC